MDRELIESLKTRDEVDLTVTGRKTGAEHRFPVWFVIEGERLYLLPVYGSQTNWYKNVTTNKRLKLSAGSKTIDVEPKLVVGKEVVEHIADLFRERYTPGEVTKYYTNFDAAIEVVL